MNEIDATEVTERDNLAVVARVERLEAIPNKDRIELVHLKDCGYTFICEKIHNVGDLVVYVKYDTIVPNNELFSFMSETKFRVKAKGFTERDEDDVIIKKIYSQGIILPIQKVSNFVYGDGSIFDEGEDLTSTLGVKKYIAPVSNKGQNGLGVMASRGDFPTSIVSKTDETNLASKIRALEEIKGKRVYITLKYEGSSLTTMWDLDRDELMVCSRNNQIGYHETNKFWKACIKRNMEHTCKRNPEYVFQEECYGVGIQKNKLGIEDVDLAVFNVSRRVDRTRLSFDEMTILLDELQLPMVKCIMVIDDFQMTFDELQELSDAQRYDNGELAEGIVIRPCEPFISRYSKDDWSYKVISREYKL